MAMTDINQASQAALFDRGAWRLHRDRAATLGVDFLHNEVADRLIDRLNLVNRDFPVALDLGSRGGGLTRLLAERRGWVQLIAAEPSLDLLRMARGPRICADPELSPFRDASLDLV